MVKNFVIKHFTALLDIFFIIVAVIIVIVGLVLIVAGIAANSVKAIFMGLLYIIVLSISLFIWAGTIYILVDIKDTLKQINARKTL